MPSFVIPNSAYADDGELGNHRQRNDRRPHAVDQFHEAQLKLNKDDSHEAKQEKLRLAVTQKMRSYSPSEGAVSSTSSGADDYPYVDSTYDDHVLVKKGGKMYALTHNMNDPDFDGDVDLGEPQEVKQTYQKVGKSKKSKQADDSGDN